MPPVGCLLLLNLITKWPACVADMRAFTPPQALIARFVVYDAEPPKAEAGVSPLGLSSQKLPIKQQASSSDVDQTLPDSSIAAKQPTSPKSSIPSATFHARVSATSSFRSSTAHPVAVQPAELALSPDMALLAPLATGFQSGFNVGYSSGIVAGIIVAMMRQHGLFPTSEIQACSLAAMPLPARHKSPVQHRLAASAQNKTQATNTTRKHTVQSGLDVPALPLHQSLANAVPRTSDKPGESGLTQWATVQWSVKSRNHLLVHSEAAKPTVM